MTLLPSSSLAHVLTPLLNLPLTPRTHLAPYAPLPPSRQVYELQAQVQDSHAQLMHQHHQPEMAEQQKQASEASRALDEGAFARNAWRHGHTVECRMWRIDLSSEGLCNPCCRLSCARSLGRGLSLTRLQA